MKTKTKTTTKTKTKTKIYRKKTLKTHKRKTIKTHKRKIKRKRGGEDTRENILSVSLENRESNLAKTLNVVCRDPGNCLAFGHYSEIIKRYFDNFSNLNLVVNSDIKRIGSPSKNGFILEIPFERKGFTALTALKCSSLSESDNLFYEYYVGKYFINQYINKFPCFVETYGLYTTTTPNSWQTLYDFAKNSVKQNIMNVLQQPQSQPVNNNTTLDIKSLISFMPQDISWNDSCLKNKQICILIQHFKNFTSLGEIYTNNKINEVVDYPLLFYQIYFPLSVLGDTYTHYDLHANNVFLYKPFQGKQYILMRYHTNNNTIIEFPSEYIVKIIDYGRNYIKTLKTNTEELLKNEICPSPACQPECGALVGYNVIQGNAYDPQAQFYDIFPNKSNVSMDLRPVLTVNQWLKDMVFNSKKTIIPFEKNFGTKEIKTGTGDPNYINNIFEMRNELEKHIPDWLQERFFQNKYNTWKKVATMDIYEDGRDMEFTLLPDI